ncbi:MAG: bifunctional folylpolyglutamate synthase/dihydrofolate synthase, partial [Hyphomicrobiales bacterium]|nr:bifunctional folylpolyglutamate synthase/dihydrofolate synthase [Hyphomicrobiales bacterium]
VPLGADHAGRPAEDTAAAARAAGMPAAAFPGVAEALRFLAARREPVPPRILIAGSLYLAGDVLAAEGRAPD